MLLTPEEIYEMTPFGSHVKKKFSIPEKKKKI